MLYKLIALTALVNLLALAAHVSTGPTQTIAGVSVIVATATWLVTLAAGWKELRGQPARS